MTLMCKATKLSPLLARNGGTLVEHMMGTVIRPGDIVFLNQKPEQFVVDGKRVFCNSVAVRKPGGGLTIGWLESLVGLIPIPRHIHAA